MGRCRLHSQVRLRSNCKYEQSECKRRTNLTERCRVTAVRRVVQKGQGVCFRNTHIKRAPQFPDRIFRPIDGLYAVKASSAQLLSFFPRGNDCNHTYNTLYNPSGCAYITQIFIRLCMACRSLVVTPSARVESLDEVSPTSRYGVGSGHVPNPGRVGAAD